MPRHDDLAIRQIRHAGRVEENRAGVGGSRGLAGVGVAQPAGVLFHQREAGGVRELGAAREREAHGQAVNPIRHEYSLED
jgi:hypothetical protein